MMQTKKVTNDESWPVSGAQSVLTDYCYEVYQTNRTCFSTFLLVELRKREDLSEGEAATSMLMHDYCVEEKAAGRTLLRTEH